MNTSIGAESWRERRRRFMSPLMSPAGGSRCSDLLMNDDPVPGMESIVRKNGKRNSVHVGHGRRAGRGLVLTARWSAALLWAYVPLASELPSPMPAPLLNVLALLAGLHALLPLDGTPGPLRTRHAAPPRRPGGTARQVPTARTLRTVARHRARKRPSSPTHRSHTMAQVRRPARPDRHLVRASSCPEQPRPRTNRHRSAQGSCCLRFHPPAGTGERRLAMLPVRHRATSSAAR